MINLSQLREYMRMQAEEDRKIKSVQVSGETIDDALREAAVELGVKVSKLEYEIVTTGNKGVFGFGKKDWTITAYEVAKKVTISGIEEDLQTVEQEFAALEEVDMPGEVCVRLAHDGVFMKVKPPKGKGESADLQMALDKLKHRGIHKFDQGMVNKLIKLSSADWVKVGQHIYNPASDAIMTVDIVDGEMKALIKVTAPGPGGADISIQDIYSFLTNNSIVEGIKEEYIQNFEDHPVFGDPYLVAEGLKPVNGTDSKITYNFETDRTKIKLKERKDGKVDFKQLNLIQNVVEGQVLARKVPPERGTPGRTVTGKYLPAKDGKDNPFGLGKNVKLSEDGRSVIAACSGQVILNNGKISVETIMVIDRDVDISVGNIQSLGTVIVKGSVQDGFSITAQGLIEVMGNVGKADLDTDGDIVVHQGINGSDDNTIRSGRSVWSKFIQNANIEAGEMVIVSDGIMNSHVNANKKILCQGKRANIVGGHLRATEEINARDLGSIAGTETILEVGYDPESKEQLQLLEDKKKRLEKQLDEVNLNMQGIIKQKQKLAMKKQQLNPEKTKLLSELNIKYSKLSKEIETLDREIIKIQDYLQSLGLSGKISASGMVHSGVKIIIKDADMDVRREYKQTTFIQEADIVKPTKYEEISEELTREKPTVR